MPPAQNPAPLRWRLLWLQSLGLALLLTWPMPQHLADGALGSPVGDIAKHLWTLWWMRKEVLTGVAGLQTTLVGWPGGMPLWPIEPLNGLLTVALPGGPVLLANLLALLHLTLGGVVTGWLGALVARRPAAAFVSGALAQGSSYAAFTMALGAGELRAFWLLPLGLGFFTLARETGGRRWFLALGVALGLGTLACFYYGFFLAVTVLALALARPVTMVKQLRGYLMAGLVALLMVAPAVRLFSTSFNPERGRPAESFTEWMSDPASTPTLDDVNDSVNLDQLVVPASVARFDTSAAARAYNGGRYLGLVALFLAAMGVVAEPRRARPWLVAVGLGVVLAGGNVLMLHGEAVRIADGRIGLPLAWLNRGLSFFVEPINFPARFLSIPAVGLAVLGGLATRWRWAAWLVPLALGDILSNDLVAWPRSLATLPEVSGLEEASGEGAVADMSPFTWTGGAPVDLHRQPPLLRCSSGSRRRAIAAQLLLDAPFAIAPIERLDYRYPDGLLWLQALPLTRALGDPQHWASDFREDEWLLRRHGFDRILITFSPDQGLRPEIDRMLTLAFGAPARSSSGQVWRVPDFDATGEQAREWTNRQRARLAGVPRPQFLPPLKDSVKRAPVAPSDAAVDLP